MPLSRSTSGESFGEAFLGTYYFDEIEQRAWVVISLAEVEVFRKRVTYGVDWLGQRSAISEAFRDLANEIQQGLRASRNRSAR